MHFIFQKKVLQDIPSLAGEELALGGVKKRMRCTKIFFFDFQ